MLGYAAVALAGLALAATVFVFIQGRRTPGGNPTYVALGSSYAAGAGLGTLQPESPLLCACSIGGYPQRVARALRLELVDVACGGAVTAHIMAGGQFFQGPQIRVITSQTQLVTLTVGGNDVGLVGDLSMLALRRQDGVKGWLARMLWHGPKRPKERDFAGLRRELLELIQAIRVRAPGSRIVVATYPAILPPAGTCSTLQLTREEADLMRPVEMKLATVTVAAASAGGAVVVDMHALGAAHNACSVAPWTRGWAALSAAPFHPNAAGAQATADAIVAALRQSPAGIAAVSQDDAASH